MVEGSCPQVATLQFYGLWDSNPKHFGMPIVIIRQATAAPLANVWDYFLYPLRTEQTLDLEPVDQIFSAHSFCVINIFTENF